MSLPAPPRAGPEPAREKTAARRPRRTVTTYPIASRRFKVKVEDFASPPSESGSFAAFWDSLPRLLAAESLRKVVSAIQEARRKRKPVVLAFGAHVLKTCLLYTSPSPRD